MPGTLEQCGRGPAKDSVTPKNEFHTGETETGSMTDPFDFLPRHIDLDRESPYYGLQDFGSWIFLGICKLGFAIEKTCIL